MDNIPTRGPSDLGAPLSNTRTPLTNEFSAVNLERIKDRIIELATDLGLGDGSTADSVWEWITNAAANVVGALASNVLAIDFNDVDLTGIGVLHPTTLTVDGDAYVGGNLTLTGTIDSLTFKHIVRLATTANGTLATAFANGQTVDGKSLVTGDRILLKNQSSAAENGIYVVNASGAPSRAYDCNAAGDLAHGLVVPVAAGDANGGHVFVCTAITAVPGSTALSFIDVGPLTRAALAALLATGAVSVTGDVNVAASGAVAISAGAVMTLASTDDMSITTPGALNIQAPGGIDVGNTSIASVSQIAGSSGSLELFGSGTGFQIASGDAIYVSLGIDMQSNPLIGVPDPAVAQDASNARYSDQPTTRAISGTTGTLGAADIGAVLKLSNAGSITFTTANLSSALRSGGSLFVTIMLTGGGTLTIADGSGCTHSGSPSGTSCVLWSDNGTTWYVR